MVRAYLPAALWLAVAAGAAGPSQGRQAHEAHVHGAAALNLALEAGELYLELDTPSANLVGFEHAPGTAAEFALVQRARALLAEPVRLFAFPERAGCRLLDIEVRMPWGEGAGRAHVEAVPADEPVHADSHAEYRFRCDGPAALDGLEVLVFEAFPAIHRLQVQTVSGDRQAALVLTPAQRWIRF